MRNELQRRYLPRAVKPPELREETGKPPVIAGYASVFFRDGDPATEYEIWPADKYGPRLVERIMPGAFDRAIKEDDIRGLFNHDPSFVLGRRAAGTLRLFVDQIGLRYEIDPPDTQTARDLLANLRRGDISGSSFAFLPRDTAHREIAASGEKPAEIILERHEVELFDVGPVTFPAYTGATSGVRAAGESLDAIRSEVDGWRRTRDTQRVAIELLLMEAEGD